MANLEQKIGRPAETVQRAPMDGDSKPPKDVGLQGDLPNGESKESLRESSVVKEHAEQQSRNSEIMKSLD